MKSPIPPQTSPPNAFFLNRRQRDYHMSKWSNLFNILIKDPPFSFKAIDRLWESVGQLHNAVSQEIRGH